MNEDRILQKKTAVSRAVPLAVLLIIGLSVLFPASFLIPASAVPAASAAPASPADRSADETADPDGYQEMADDENFAELTEIYNEFRQKLTEQGSSEKTLSAIAEDRETDVPDMLNMRDIPDMPDIFLTGSSEKTSGSTGSAVSEESETAGYSPDRIIVCFDMDKISGIPEMPEGHNAEFYPDLVPGLAVVHLPDDVSAEEALAYYSGLPYVRYAEFDRLLTSSGKRETAERERISGNDEGKTGQEEAELSASGAVSSYTPEEPYEVLQWSFKNIGQIIKTSWSTINGNGSVTKGENDIRGTPDCDISADDAKELSQSSSDVIVAVIDSGVLYTHPDLADNIYVNPGEIPGNGIDDDGNGFIDDVNGWDFYDDDNMPLDPDGHGTHCAGTIGAVRNGLGTVGVAENVTIMPLRYMGEDGGYVIDEIRAINYAAKMGADIVSCSFSSENFSKIEYEIIRNSDMLFVCAAGNYKNSSERYPAAYDCPNIISVISTDAGDHLSDFSNFGPTCDLAAPGEYIFQTCVIETQNKTVFSPDTCSIFQDTSLQADYQLNNGSFTVSGVGMSMVCHDEPIRLNGQNAQIYLTVTGMQQATKNYSDIFAFIYSSRPYSSYGSFSEMIQSDDTVIVRELNASQPNSIISCRLYNDLTRTVLNINAGGAQSLWQTDEIYISYLYFGFWNDSRMTVKNEVIYSSEPGWAVDSGTSMAVPHVSGTAALMLSANPDLTPEQMADILRFSVDRKESLRGTCQSEGRLNESAAVMEAMCYPVMIDFGNDPDENVRMLIDHLADGDRAISGAYDLNRDQITDGRDLILLQNHVRLLKQAENRAS